MSTQSGPPPLPRTLFRFCLERTIALTIIYWMYHKHSHDSRYAALRFSALNLHDVFKKDSSRPYITFAWPPAFLSTASFVVETSPMDRINNFTASFTSLITNDALLKTSRMRFAQNNYLLTMENEWNKPSQITKKRFVSRLHIWLSQGNLADG